MRIDKMVRDYPAFLKDLIEALNSDKTYIYLDTSLLMWLIRLGANARNEFIAWCDNRAATTVRIPVWAAHELHRHLIAGTVGSNLKKTIGDARAKYDDFIRLAAERADEALCLAKGYPGRASFVGDLELSYERFQKLTRVIEGDDNYIYEAGGDVIAFVNKYVIDSDVSAIIEKLSGIGEFRYRHRVPPGFEDQKEENRYGDLIIWEELVHDVAAAGLDHSGGARNAVLITRDHKKDWVSGSRLLTTQQGDTIKSNRNIELDVSLPHPLLVHEFVLRAKADRLFVTHPAFLAHALDYDARRNHKPSPSTQWLSASHRHSDLKTMNDTHGGVSSEIERGEAKQKYTPGQPAIAKPIVLEGVTAQDVMSVDVTEEARLYINSMPDDQIKIFNSWTAGLKDGLVEPFAYGRILAELVVASMAGLAEQVPGLVEQLLATLEPERVNKLTLAFAASAYFNLYGELRRRPQLDVGAATLLLEQQSRLSAAFSALQHMLKESGANLPYLPGSALMVHCRIDVDGQQTPRMIRDIRVGKASALASTEGPRSLSSLLGSKPEATCSGTELRALIAREYLIPSERLGGQPEKKLTWQPDAGLVRLDTESEGGLSAFDEEDFDNG
jgi:hypothetical protein